MIAGGLKAPVEAELRNDIWIKLMGNVAFNPISALTRATMVEMCQHPGTRRVVTQLMEETLDIAARVGSHSGHLHREAPARRRERRPPQDLDASGPGTGKQLELDAIVTAVVEMADLTGAAAPTLRTVHAATDLLARTCAPAPPQAVGTLEKESQPAMS